MYWIAAGFQVELINPMKRPLSNVKGKRAEKVACTVSAAALMLGVSQAATVGLKFTVDYCGFANYVNYVNAPAFGVPMNQWQNLTAMGTGYHSCSGTTFFSLNEIVDTNSASGGLHPLPNGSLTLNWSGQCANWSGFSGYDSGTPPQPITSGPPVPEAQVYAGFIRDGVNFGPGSSGGDNNQPGYSIDIVGLKTLFTNTPFAVQLIAASDSMQYLTNAFIIDATLNSTQSVTYPKPQTYGNVGDTAWFRATGGGLSTASGSFTNTDHLQIIGNRAAHSAGPPAFNFASTISGAIITDKPVISMSPKPVVVAPGDSVTWSGYAVGVPPLSYQWRHDGVPVPGATTSSFTIPTVTAANRGSYDLVVTNLYGSAVSAPVPVDQIAATVITNLVLDTNPNGPEHDGLNSGTAWLATSGTHSGVASFNGTNQNEIVVPGQISFDVGAGTISFWMRSSGLINPTGHPAALLDRRGGSGGLVIAQTSSGSVEVKVTTAINDFTSTSTVLSDDNWHHVSVVFNITNGEAIQLYIDGATDASSGNAADWSWAPGQELEFGLSHDASSWQPYNGLLDDVRFYNRALAASDIASIFNTGALVDTAALVMRLNFDTAPVRGLNLSWRVTDVILQSANSVTGPYTDIPANVSPYPTSFKNAAKFFRYHGHSATNVVSNPYFM
jgi:hypothetical protein